MTFSTGVTQYSVYSDYLIGHVAFEGVSLNEGSYTAVAWADFVLKKTDGSYDVVNSSNEDLHYQTAQLSSIVDNLNQNIDDDFMEVRDAYTGIIKFTMAKDGSVTNTTPDANAHEGSIFCIEAKRKFGKVRVIMGDYNTKFAWENYFAGQGTDKVLNALDAKFHGVASGYNALSQSPTAASGDLAASVAWNSNDATNAKISWVIPGDGDIKFESISAEDYMALGESDIVYPVLDFNYMIPSTNDATSAYNMDFTAKSDDNTIKHMGLSNIPVHTNTLTTIFGPFLTYTLQTFSVYLNDSFDKYVDVIAGEDGDTYSVMAVDSVIVEVLRDPAGIIQTINVGNIFAQSDLENSSYPYYNIDFNTASPITVDNFNEVWAQIIALESFDPTVTVVNFYVKDKDADHLASIPVNAEFNGVSDKVLAITLRLFKDLDLDTTIETDAFLIRIKDFATQNSNLEVNNLASKVEFVDGTFNGTVNINADQLKITNGIYNALLSLNKDNISGAANIAGGVFNGQVNSFMGYVSKVAIASYSSTTYLTGGSTSDTAKQLFIVGPNLLKVGITEDAWVGKLNCESSTEKSATLQFLGVEKWEEANYGTNFVILD